MRNITLSIDDEVLSAVRRHAAERNTTVNAMVREYLGNLAALDDRARKVKDELLRLSNESPVALGKITWTRDELHER